MSCIPVLVHDNTRLVEWNFDSGTSMSCPHISGVVAILRSAHPKWSPSAIRSALMTTAYNTDKSGDTISIAASTKSSDPFDIDGGNINSLKAFDPGLVYDMTTRDYVVFLCNSGYTEQQIQAMVISLPNTSMKCPEKPEPVWNTNYPSITVSNLERPTTVGRTVHNVGRKKTAVYFLSHVDVPDGVEVIVRPKILIFSAFKDEATYFVSLKPLKVSQGRYEITWCDMDTIMLGVL